MKVVLDTSVVLASVYSRKFGSQSASRRLFELMVTDSLEVLTSDIILGECLRIVATDPKLSKANPPYLEARMTEYQEHAVFVSTDEIRVARDRLNFPPTGFNDAVNDNDVHIVALAIAKRASYLITFDHPLLEAFETSSLSTDLSTVTPAQFLNLERRRFP